MGVYKAENFVFSPVSSLRLWRSHLFVWRLRKPINLSQVCISNDRAVPTPGFKQYNSRPTQTKTTKQTYRSFDNFYFDFPHHCNKNDYFLSKFKANISTLYTRESQQILLSYTILIIRNRYIFHYKILLFIATNPVLGEIMTDSPS